MTLLLDDTCSFVRGQQGSKQHDLALQRSEDTRTWHQAWRPGAPARGARLLQVHISSGSKLSAADAQGTSQHTPSERPASEQAGRGSAAGSA